MERHSFATLVTFAGAAPTATHLPLLLQRDAGPHGTLFGHLARANPQWGHFASGAEALVIFQGPHSYISPSYYATSPAVPTWNYVAVHAYGVPGLIEDADGAAALLAEMVRHYEAGMPVPWSGDLPEDYRAKLMQGLVAFSIPIRRLEGTFKLGQARPPVDVMRTFEALSQSPDQDARRLAEWMEIEGMPVRPAPSADGQAGQRERNPLPSARAGA
jgi:transcriptional regulator